MKSGKNRSKRGEGKNRSQIKLVKAKSEKSAKSQSASKSTAAMNFSSITLGELVCQIIAEQFDRIVKQERDVLADKDPEPLHQMRVGTRRLRTALQVFESVVEVPKAASAKRLRDLARTLGAVRDLDVQMASLGQDYHPNLNAQEQKKLNAVSKSLRRQRVEALKKMKSALTQKQYRSLKKTYQTWLKHPQLTEVAQLPVTSALPDILSPLLAELLLHPGWLVSSHNLSDEQSEILHDLRKVCKHVRYQTEFFVPFYGEEFQNWIKEIKQLQDDLGAFQDTQVLKDLLNKELGDRSQMPGLNALIRQEQSASLAGWEDIRKKYLDSGFRYHLHQMLLQPSDRAMKVHPELVEQN